jgi:phage baseplate assembly protein W
MGKLIGLSFPFRKGNSGIPAINRDNDVIKGSVKQILETRIGERIMEPEFGSILHRLVFENNNELMIVKIKEEVYRALNAWEPRISILKVDVEIEDSLVTTDIYYEYLSEADDVSIEMDRSIE